MVAYTTVEFVFLSASICRNGDGNGLIFTFVDSLALDVEFFYGEVVGPLGVGELDS